MAIMSIVFMVAIDDSFSNTVLKLYLSKSCLLLAMPSYKMQSSSEKIIFGIWILLGFCIATIYKCNLKAMLTTQKLTIPFETLEDLIQRKDYKVHVLKEAHIHRLAKV